MHCVLRMMNMGRPCLYSLHAFPIYRRSFSTQISTASKPIKIPVSDFPDSRRNLAKDIFQEGQQPASSSLPEESTVSNQLRNTSGYFYAGLLDYLRYYILFFFFLRFSISRSCPAPHNLLPNSSSVIESSVIGAVNEEEDNLTDSGSGSAGSGIGLLLASAAGKVGSSFSESGSGSNDSAKEFFSTAFKFDKIVLLSTWLSVTHQCIVKYIL